MSMLVDLLTIVFGIMAISATGSNVIFAVVSVALTICIFMEWGGKLDSRVCGYKPFVYLVMFILCATIEVLISGEIPFGFVLSRWSMFLPVLLFIYYENSKKKKRLIQIFVVITFVVGLYASYLYTSEIISARRLAAHMDNIVLFSGGGYGYAVAAAVLGVFFLELLLWRKIRISIPIIALEIVLTVTVFLTESTTTIVAMIIGAFSCLMLRIFSVNTFSNLDRKKILGLALICLTVVGVISGKGMLGNLLINFGNAGTGVVYRRLVELGALLRGGAGLGGNSDIIGRMDLLKQSISTFLQYPLLGLTSRFGTNYYTLFNMGIGSHGELFDSFARYGLFAGIPYIGIFVSNFIFERKMQILQMGFGYVITLIVLFLFNPCLYFPANMIIFFIIPMITKQLQIEESY